MFIEHLKLFSPLPPAVSSGHVLSYHFLVLRSIAGSSHHQDGASSS
jgi:hypothetical protein